MSEIMEELNILINTFNNKWSIIYIYLAHILYYICICTNDFCDWIKSKTFQGLSMLAEFTVKYVIQKIKKKLSDYFKIIPFCTNLDFYIERDIFILIHKMQVI